MLLLGTLVCRLKATGSAGEAYMLKKYAEQYARQIVGLLGVLPSDMLLLLKTNDCLRHLDTQLGTPINSTEGNIVRQHHYL